MLVEEDANNSQECGDELFHAAGDAGKKLYEKGDYAKSNISDLDVYLLRKVMTRMYPNPTIFCYTLKILLMNELFFRLVYFQMS